MKQANIVDERLYLSNFKWLLPRSIAHIMTYVDNISRSKTSNCRIHFTNNITTINNKKKMAKICARKISQMKYALQYKTNVFQSSTSSIAWQYQLLR